MPPFPSSVPVEDPGPTGVPVSADALIGQLAPTNDRVEPKSHRVLIVDDNPTIHQDIAKVLGSHSADEDFAALENQFLGKASPPVPSGVRFELDNAYQGSEGLALARRAVEEDRPFAVAFVDMRMPPGMDGLETILELWKIDPQIQIVICSAYSDYSWRDIIDATGETDQLVILRKPFEVIEVLQLTHALAKKWELQSALRRHIVNLEALVLERTRELKQKQAIFELILENVADLIAVVDSQGNRIYNSPSYRTVLGFEPEELGRTHAFAQIHPDDAGAVQHAVETARKTGRGELVVYRMRHKDGSWRTLESCAGVVQDAGGQPAYFVIVARDITARHETELKNRLGQKLESIGRLAAGVAHEINTPTQFIIDNTRFLTDGFAHMARILGRYREWRDRTMAQADTESARALAAAEAEAELDYLLTEIPRALQQNLEGLGRVARIVQSLKEFSHPSAPGMTPADLNHAIETAIAVSRHEWKYAAEVVTEFDPALPPVPCIVDELNQVMLNLIVNAAHTIAEALKVRGETRGKIVVRTRAVDGMAVVEVSDTGMGIPPEFRDRIFEPFFTTKEVGMGTGQGLAIVHAVVVKHHQGSVDFSTEIGQGTTFRFRLPLDPPAA